MGLIAYYYQFTKDFSKIARPLSNLTKKHGNFIWDAKCDESFQELKKRLTMAPVLILTNGKDGFTVYTDASKEGFGCGLI